MRADGHDCGPHLGVADPHDQRVAAGRHRSDDPRPRQIDAAQEVAADAQHAAVAQANRQRPETDRRRAKQVVNLELANRQISVHPAVESAAPLGLVNYQTSSLFRNIRLKKLN